MAKIFEERKCIVCGKTWIVEVKKHHKGKSDHCFCAECSKTLTSTEKNIYYKAHIGSHIIENRVCLHCGKEWKVLTAKDRIGKKIKKHYFCSECSKVLTTWGKKKIMEQKREGFKEKMYEEKRRSRLNNIQSCIWVKAKQRAEKYRLDFNIDVSDIHIPDICPILEVPLEYGTKGDYEYSPSIDRIDTTKGYVKGNIAIISKKANSMKNNATFEELQKFCKNILRYSLNNKEKELVELQDKELVG